MFISAMRHRVAHTVEAVFIVLVSRESFKYMIKYTLQTVANQFLISIYFIPCTHYKSDVTFQDVRAKLFQSIEFFFRQIMS